MAEKDALDELDIKILKILQYDARQSSREIAKKLNVATGTVYSRIKKLTESGIVKGYTAIIEPTLVGFDLTVVTLMRIEPGYLVDVENEVAKLSNVCSVYDITGEFDAAFIARFRNRAALNYFIKSVLKIPHLRGMVTSVVLNVVKEDHRVDL
jgi:DNA-binding Lrp family transcriptional regulator